MSSDRDEGPRRYVVVESDRFEADRDRAVLSVYRLLGPKAAGEWAVGLSRALSALPDFPGPLSHAQDEAASTFYGREVRRLLYYGPTRRRSGTPVRLFFSIVPPDPADPPETAETVLFLLRLLQGAQVLQPDDHLE